MDNAVQQVEQATDYAKQSGEALDAIVGTVENTVGQVKAIAAASEEQSAASEQITHTIDQVNHMVADTSQSMRASSTPEQKKNRMMRLPFMPSCAARSMACAFQAGKIGRASCRERV